MYIFKDNLIKSVLFERGFIFFNVKSLKCHTFLRIHWTISFIITLVEKRKSQDISQWKACVKTTFAVVSKDMCKTCAIVYQLPSVNRITEMNIDLNFDLDLDIYNDLKVDTNGIVIQFVFMKFWGSDTWHKGQGQNGSFCP